MSVLISEVRCAKFWDRWRLIALVIVLEGEFNPTAKKRMYDQEFTDPSTMTIHKVKSIFI